MTTSPLPPFLQGRGQPALAPWRLALITIMQFKVHLSETCDADAPHLITHVETTPTTTKDHQVTEPVHQALESQELLPQEHLVDGGYVDAELYHFPK